jgi:hypothetical protein
MQTKLLKGGLNLTPKDERDFLLGAIITLPKLSELPESFSFETLNVKDQKDTDYCTAFASCLVSELQEEVELCPEWSFAASKEISGDADKFGQDIRVAMKTHQKVGAIEKKVSPYSLENKEDSFLRKIANWPKNLYNFALFHSKESYFKITGPYDHYDNIRASIWKFRDMKRGVVTGVVWSWNLSDVLLTGISENGSGHCIPIKGWNKEGEEVQNSYGLQAGKNGIHFISRETVNHFVEMYGAYMFVDISPEKAHYYLERGVKIEEISILTEVVRLLKILITKLNANKLIKSIGEILEAIFSKTN